MLEKMNILKQKCKYPFITQTWKVITKKTIAYIFLAIISVLLKISFAFLVSEIINSAVNCELDKLKILAVYLVLFLVVRYITSRMLSKVSFKIFEEARRFLRNKLMNQFISLPLHINVKFKNYENSVITNVDMIIDDYYKAVLDLIENFITLVVALIVLVNTNLFITLNILLFAAVQLLIPKIYNNKLTKTRKKYFKANDQHYKILKELSLIKSLFYSKCFSEYQENKYQKINDELRIASINKDTVSANLRICTFVLSQFMYLSTMMIGAYFTYKGYMTVGTVVAASQLMNYVTSPLSEIIADIGLINASMVAKDKIDSIFKMKKDSECLAVNTVQKNFTNNILEFKNISLQLNDRNTYILNNINFTIKKGEKVLIIGESGSGKTSLAKLITKEIIPTNGFIYLNNMNISELNDSVVHNFLSYIPAHSLTFDGNIIDNVTLYGNYHIKSIQPLINKFGLSDDISDNIHNCSSGELQRISIIRSILENKQLTIADESTAHLDLNNQKIVEETIINSSDTLIYISHNSNNKNLESFDRVIELSHGNIIYDGIPKNK